MVDSTTPLEQKIGYNFYLLKKTFEEETSPPDSDVLDRAFSYRLAVYTEYLYPFLVAKIKTKTKQKMLAAIDKNTAEGCRACIKAFPGECNDFHKFVLPLEPSDLKGLPLYFSPRPLRSNAVTMATAKYPVKTLLKYDEPRPKALAVTSLNEVGLKVKDFQTTLSDKKAQPTYYASVKFDGHAAIWTGKGLITKDGRAVVRYVPKELKTQLSKFSNEMLLGELVFIRNSNDVEGVLNKHYNLKATNTDIYSRNSLSTLYGSVSSVSAKVNAKKRTGRLMFFVYDIISYNWREKPFSERYKHLKRVVEQEKPSRIFVVEQFQLGPLLTGKGSRGSSKTLLDAKLSSVFGNQGQAPTGIKELKLLLFGCIIGNQEGIVLKPDVPFYDLYKTKSMALKLKARLRFMAEVKEDPAAKKIQKWFEGAANFKRTAMLSLPATIFEQAASSNAKDAYNRDKLEEKQAKIEYTIQGKTRLHAPKFVSITNVYDVTGFQLEPVPDRYPRNFEDLITPGLANLAQTMFEYYEKMNDGQKRLPPVKAEFAEARKLLAIGNTLYFQEFPIVGSPTKLKVLETENKNSKKVPFDAFECQFTEEPNNDRLFHILSALPAQQLTDSNDDSFNRWIPALKRFIDKTEKEWLKIAQQLPVSDLSLKLVREPQMLPDKIVVYERRSAMTDIYTIKTTPFTKNKSSGIKYYINRFQPQTPASPLSLAVQEVRFAYGFDNARPNYPKNWRQKSKKKCKVHYLYNDEDRTEFAENADIGQYYKIFRPEADGGFGVYNNQNLTNGIELVYYLSHLGPFATPEYNPDNWNLV